LQVAQGLPSINSLDPSLIPAAVTLALASDIVILSVGNSLVLEHEGMDRVSIDLPEGQKWLIGNVSAALAGSGKPVIAVTYGGGVSRGTGSRQQSAASWVTSLALSADA
jgi:hypothetical protein